MRKRTHTATGTGVDTMRALLWLAVAVAGLCLMIAAHGRRFQPDPSSQWAGGLLVYGPSITIEPDLRLTVVPAQLRLLPGSERTEAVIKALRTGMPGGPLRVKAMLRPKLLRMSLGAAHLETSALQSGRLPEKPGEVLAGAAVEHKDQVTVDGKTLHVVGQLRPDEFLLSDCYVLATPDSNGDLFKGDDAHKLTLVGLSPEQLEDRSLLRKLTAKIDHKANTVVMPLAPFGRREYHLYVFGKALFLVGGSGLLIGLYHWLARRPARVEAAQPGEANDPDALLPAPEKTPSRASWITAPFVVLTARPGLLWAAHVIFFGLYIAGALLAYEAPEVNAVLMSAVGEAITSPGNNPLAMAGRAYGSGNILAAAAVTFQVNFLLGALASITLPSLILFGVGGLLAMLRTFVWGLLLGPTKVVMAAAMIPHTGTLLLEGEGYLLAALLGVLIPVYLVHPGLGPTFLGRLKRVLLLNLQGYFAIAVILGIAAIYEAIEVIYMAH